MTDFRLTNPVGQWRTAIHPLGSLSAEGKLLAQVQDERGQGQCIF